MIRAVLDTNVIVSGILHPGGIPDRIIQAWKSNRFELCLSEQLFQELDDVLKRPKIQPLIPGSLKELEEFLISLAKISTFVAEPLAIPAVVSPDPDDNIVLATASAAQADAIVSGDHHLLDLKQYRRIPIITPRNFLETLDEINPR